MCKGVKGVRYAIDSFSPTFITTIGIDFKIKTIELDGKRIKLQIRDTEGQERFRTIMTSYYRGAQGIVLTYDVTDRNSFNSITNWLVQIQQHADSEVNMILVGNKCDKLDDVQVSTEEGRQFADKYGLNFFETSAKSGYSVEKAFAGLTRVVKDRLIADGQGNPALTEVKPGNANETYSIFSDPNFYIAIGILFAVSTTIIIKNKHLL